MIEASSVLSGRRPNFVWRRLLPLQLLLAVGAAILWVSTQAPAANAAATASQCNGEMNGGGTEVACTVTVTNYLTAAGSLAASPASAMTLTRCVGATGPVSTLTCTTTVTTLSEPVSTVR